MEAGKQTKKTIIKLGFQDTEHAYKISVKRILVTGSQRFNNE